MKKRNNTNKKMLLIPTLLTFFAIPVLVSAQIKYEVESFINITPTDGIEGLLSALLNIFIVIATPIVVLFIIYAGFLYVTARGNPQQIEQATRAFTYAVIGGVIILGAVALGEIIKNVVEAFRNTPD
jgi:hypothetical protein